MFTEPRTNSLKESERLPFVVCTIGEAANLLAVNKPRGNSAHQLMIATSGSVEFTFAGETFTLSEGEGILWKRGLPFSYRPVGDRFDAFILTFLVSASVFNYYQLNDLLKFKSCPQLMDSLKHLQMFCEGESNMLTRSSAGYSCFAQWLYSTFEPSMPLTVRVMRFLEANYSKQISLDDVADSVHMSKFALCHYYKEKCGSTVMKTLQNIRISKAKEFLRYEDLSIGDVAQRCGFVNLSYFDKVFQATNGCTPHEYRVGHK